MKSLGCLVYQAESDADTLIVSTALDLDSEKHVVVAADDTDILVLLCYHWNHDLESIYLSTEQSDGSKRKN